LASAAGTGRDNQCETGKARIASPRDAVPSDVIGRHFRDQGYAIALASNNAPDQLLGAAIAVHLRRVDQGHPEQKACAQRFFLSGFRMFTLPETRRALAERRDHGSVV
jgi:hypothetical protein